MNREEKFATKALVALATHEDLMQRVAGMKIKIGQHINECSTARESVNHYGKSDHDDYYDQSGMVKTHLWHAYRHLEPSTCHPGMVQAGEGDQEVYLTEEDTGCSHCYAAWKLIQERKEVRQQLGIAKRSIRALGKVAKGFYQ